MPTRAAAIVILDALPSAKPEPMGYYRLMFCHTGIDDRRGKLKGNWEWPSTSECSAGTKWQSSEIERPAEACNIAV